MTSILWPYESNELTPAQQIRMQDFRDDIERARAANRAGFSYHIWIDGRYYDSAVTHQDAFEQCRSMRKEGERAPMLIGSGSTDRTLTVSADGVALRIELPS
jgi:hypothetical protein